MSYYAVEAEHASRLQYGRYSLRITSSNLIVVSDGVTEKIFDLNSFIVTPFNPSGTLMSYPYPTDSGVTIDVTTLYEAMRLMAEYIIGLHSASETAFSEVRTVQSGFNTNGTELTITKLNGYRTYGSVGGISQAIPGPAPWIVGVREDGVAEVGRMLDFHTSYTTGTNDSTCRVTCTGSNALSIPNLSVSGVLSGPTITGLTTRMTNEETASTTLRTDVDGLTTRMTAEETLSTTLRTDVDGLTTRMTNEETASTTLRTDVDGLTTRMTTAEGTIANHTALIGSASSSAAAVNARVTKLLGTYFYPNGYDDPSNTNWRTLEWVVDYMLKYIIPVLGEESSANTIQSWMLGVFGVLDVVELGSLYVGYGKITTMEAAIAAHGVQLAAHAMTLEANSLSIVNLQAEATAAKAAILGNTTSITSLAFLGGVIGVGIYSMINRGNGPMKKVPSSYKPVPITADTDPVALIGFTDPIARVINEVDYEVADARLIRFDGTDARIDPILKVNTIVVETLNGVSPSDYALTSSLSQYALVSSLSSYVTVINLTNTLYSYATKAKVDGVSARVTTIEADYALASSLSNYALTSSLSDYALTSSLNDYALTSSLSQYALTSELSSYALTSSLSNYALTSSLSDYALISSLSQYALTSSLNSYALASSLSNYALTSSLNDYALTSSLSDYALTSSLSSYALASSLSDYALTSSLSDYALTSSLSQYALTSELNDYVLASELNDYALTSELSNYALTSSLSQYALTSSLSSYALTSSLDTLSGRVTTVETKTSGFNADGTELTVSKLNGLFIGSGVPTTSPWIARVTTDGVMEVGRILDFHTDYANTQTDFTCRVTCTGNSLSIPNISVSGSVSVTGTVTGSNITTVTNKVTTLETKTTGLSYSSGTTVFDTVPKIGTESLIDLIYPVGTVYQSTVSGFDPNTKWGGTWTKMEGVFLLGSSSTRVVGDTGGSEKVTIGLNHLPDHTHDVSDFAANFVTEAIYGGISNSNRTYANSSAVYTQTTSAINRTESQSQMSIMPPYEVVNVWKRNA